MKQLIVGIGADTKELEDKARKAGATLLEFTDTSIMNIGQMRKELKTLGKMSLEGLDPAQIQNITARMAELRDAAGDFGNTIKSLSGDPMEKVAEAIGSATTMANGLSAAYGMLGGDQKEMEAMMQRTVGLMAIANAAQEASIFLNERAYGIFIKNKAKEIAAWLTETLTINSASAAANTFNNVIAKNPIIWLIASVAALSIGVYYLVTSFDAAKESAEKLRREIEQMTTAIEDTKAWDDFASALDDVFDVDKKSLNAITRLRNYKAQLEDMQTKLGFVLASGEATDEEKKRYSELSKEIIKVGDQIILAKAKQRKQDLDDQKEADKKAAEEAKKAAEKRKQEEAKRRQEKLDAEIAALEKQYDYEVELYEQLQAVKKSRDEGAVDILKADTADAEKIMDDIAKSIEDVEPAKIALPVKFNISGAMSGLIEDISASLGEAVATADFSNFGASILAGIAGFMQQVGAMFIAFGTAKLVFEMSGNPYAMIAAGAAMVAIGAGIKAATSKSASKAAMGGGAAGGGGQSGGWDVTRAQASWADQGGQVTFKIAGSDLVGVLGNETTRKTAY